MLKEYHKIETIYNRDTNGTKKLIEGDFRSPLVKYLSNNEWTFTEKIDGVNIRVYWDGHNISLYGRTDKSTIPTHLLQYLQETFNNAETEELFEQLFGEKEVTLYGESYGIKIQNGGLYRPDVSFILFDVLVENIWLNREDVEDIAKTFSLECVPIIFKGTLQQAVEYVKDKPKSTIGTANMEGLVGKPNVEILDKQGKRVVVKIKVRDFAD